LPPPHETTPAERALLAERQKKDNKIHRPRCFGLQTQKKKTQQKCAGARRVPN
jgi:hypothetical protein